MRALYTLLWYLAAPFLPLRLWWRARREPGYRKYVGERFGRYANPVRPPLIWVHAVSLGETRAAAPLVARLQQTYPQATLLVTHMTATGRAAGEALFGKRIVQAWLPYDLPFAVRSFLAHFKPRIGLIMETELWPNLIALARDASVPIFVVNARMSEKSAARYRLVSGLTRSMLSMLTGIAAQTKEDAGRLQALGARPPMVMGNLKFDVDVPAQALVLGTTLRARFSGGGERPVFLAASTRDGEEALILDALARQPLPPEVLTVIVPRHPQRFDSVAELLRARGVRFVRRSSVEPVSADVRLVLGDSLGEMLSYYAAADIAFVGGSLLPLGGQNLIEAIALGTPVLVGPHTFNFTEATAGAIARGAAIRVSDADSLVAKVRSLVADPLRREAMHGAGLAFHASHRGATDRLWHWLAPELEGQVASLRDRD
jgi:3-deoxy-D-manno-octulosonic-acid transferase